MSSISQLLTGQNILIGLVILFLGFAVYSYSKSKSFSMDGMTSNLAMNNVGITGSGEPSVRNSSAQNIAPPMMMGSPAQSYESTVGATGAGYSGKPVNSPTDLLPSDVNSAWAKLNPNSDTNQVIIPDLLEAGYHIGLDTIGQTLKNPNLQERSEPIIPKQNVSPWNNSSFEPDIARVPLEIGYGCN